MPCKRNHGDMAVDTSEQDLQKILNWLYCVDSRYDRGPVLIECKFRVPLSKLRFKIVTISTGLRRIVGQERQHVTLVFCENRRSQQMSVYLKLKLERAAAKYRRDFQT